MEPKQVIVFSLGKQDFACDILSVREVIRVPDITPVPAGSGFLEGVANLRGRIVPVMDLRKRLGFKRADPGRHARMLIAETEGRSVGFIVDSVSGVAEMAPGSVEPPPRELADRALAKFIDGVTRKDDKLLVLIDLRKILTEREIEELRE